MSEYSLKFKDLEEGKIYKASYGGKYRIIQGLLWSFRTSNWSDYSHSQSSQIRFKEIIEVSEDVKNVLRNVKSEFKYIAKSRNGYVELFKYKPEKNKNWWGNGVCNYLISDHFDLDFNFLSWEDEEPTRISDLV